MDVASGEIHDWEEIQVGSDTELIAYPKSADGCCTVEHDVESEGLIKLDYFSFDKDGEGYARTTLGEMSDEGSEVESDNPSWIDPGTETSRYLQRASTGFWSDSGSNLSDDRKVGEFDYDVQGTEGKCLRNEFAEENLNYLEGKTENDFAVTALAGIGSDRRNTFGNTTELDQLWSHSSGDSVPVSSMIEANENGAQTEGIAALGQENLTADAEACEKKVGPCQEKKELLWWRMPFEIIKQYVLRVSPLWSLSMAAAIFGFVVLGKKLYQMKRKALSLQVKNVRNDKKVSQAMSRAAKLNEAFTWVKRAPTIRPLLPEAGVSPYPMVTLR